MDPEKYNRSVSLLCPTCGCDQFTYTNGEAQTIELAKCASCGREITKDELIKENSENISEHIKEMGNDITEDIANELRESLKNIFKGSNSLRIK